MVRRGISDLFRPSTAHPAVVTAFVTDARAAKPDVHLMPTAIPATRGAPAKPALSGASPPP